MEFGFTGIAQTCGKYSGNLENLKLWKTLGNVRF